MGNKEQNIRLTKPLGKSRQVSIPRTWTVSKNDVLLLKEVRQNRIWMSKVTTQNKFTVTSSLKNVHEIKLLGKGLKNNTYNPPISNNEICSKELVDVNNMVIQYTNRLYFYKFPKGPIITVPKTI